MASLIWSPTEIKAPGDGRFGAQLRAPRLGVMLHYDGSATDAGGLGWFADPRCEVSYQAVVLDDGSWAQIAPDTARAWHAGECRTSDPRRLPYTDANSVFFGIAALTNSDQQVTEAQRLTIAWITRRWFLQQSWNPLETWRIVGHDTEAAYPAGHTRAGQRGRKVDPTGPHRLNPILSVEDIRYLVPRLNL